MEEVKEVLDALVRHKFNLAPHERLYEDMRFEDLGADSLDTVELILAVESHFQVNLPNELTESLSTFGDLLYATEKAVACKSAKS